MSHLNFTLDADRLGSYVNAAIRPAVEQALAEIDIKAVIVAKLKEPLASERDMYSMMLYGRGRSKSSLLDDLVHSGIQQLAADYVRERILDQKSEIEEAFRKMMAGSANRLVKAFAKATEDALQEDWGFCLDVKVKHKASADSDDE